MTLLPPPNPLTFKTVAASDNASDGSRRAVDLTALDTFIEFKRRIGTAASGEPDPNNVRQLDDYLAQSATQRRVRMGVLTDGKRWVLHWPGAGEARLTRPYAFTPDKPDGWLPLYEWLRASALVSLEDVVPDREGIAEHSLPKCWNRTSPPGPLRLAAIRCCKPWRVGWRVSGGPRRCGIFRKRRTTLTLSQR